jgi:uncharacterized repeat protein (TIGR01451 family)
MSIPRSIAGALAFASILITPAVASAATADLSVTNPVITGETTPGAEITYTYAVSNAGPEASEVMVNDALSELEQLISITPSQGTCAPADGGSMCSVGTLAPGASVAFAVKVKLTTAGNYQHTVFVNDPAGGVDPNQDNNVGGVGFNVDEPEEEFVETPTARTGGWERTQSTLKVDAELSPFGAGTYYFEYGKTKAYGNETDVEKISTQKSDVTRKAVLDGLAMKTKYHYRVVLVVDGKTYRGKDKTATTFGELLYPLITIKAVKRTASSTTYEGSIGDGFADAPGACKGTITMNVYTEGGDIMNPKTKVNAKTCEYRITIPFGTSDARKYGPKGKGAYVQARFSGTKAVAAAGSTSDRP